MIYIILWLVIGYIFAALATYLEKGHLTNRDLIEGIGYMFLGIVFFLFAIYQIIIFLKKYPDHKISKKINNFLNKKII